MIRAKRNQRCMVRVGDGSMVYGTLVGYVKRNQGKWNVARYSIVALDDGTTFETILPVYSA